MNTFTRLKFFSAGLLGAGLLLPLLSPLESAQSRSVASQNAEDPRSIPGFATYRLTDLQSHAEVEKLYRLLRTDLTHNPWNACADRANTWAYQMNRAKQVNSGKVFLFYTSSEVTVQGKNGPVQVVRANTGNPAGRPWWYHVAPYVAAGDKMYVMENFEYMNRPIEIHEWLKAHTKGAECVEVKGDPSEGPILEQLGIARKIRVPVGGAPCFYRRTPMYYHYPSGVRRHDFERQPELAAWNPGSVLGGCVNSMNGLKPQRKQRCRDFLNHPEADLGTGWAPPLEVASEAPTSPSRAGGSEESVWPLIPQSEPAESRE